MNNKKEHKLHRLLGAVFQQHVPQTVRENILEWEFGIKLAQDGKERLQNMCNLGEGIREMALEEGMEKGKAIGIIETCMKLQMPEADIIEKLKEIMAISEEEARRYYDQAAMQVI